MTNISIKTKQMEFRIAITNVRRHSGVHTFADAQKNLVFMFFTLIFGVNFFITNFSKLFSHESCRE